MLFFTQKKLATVLPNSISVYQNFYGLRTHTLHTHKLDQPHTVVT